MLSQRARMNSASWIDVVRNLGARRGGAESLLHIVPHHLEALVLRIRPGRSVRDRVLMNGNITAYLKCQPFSNLRIF